MNKLPSHLYLCPCLFHCPFKRKNEFARSHIHFIHVGNILFDCIPFRALHDTNDGHEIRNPMSNVFHGPCVFISHCRHGQESL